MFSLGSLGAGVRYAYTGRAGGLSAPPYDSLNLSPDVGDDAAVVAANRQRVLHHVGVSAAVWLRARHGGDVAVIDRAPAPGDPAPRVDALVTALPGLALAALSADCVLISLADPTTGVIGAAHCGRPGLVSGIVAATVSAMRERGADTIRAAVGPSVCGACYEVPQAMADAVSAVVPAAAAITRDGRPALDVGAGVVAQLRDRGVEVVRRVGGCTREDPALFSYRRAAVTGRQAAIVWLDR